MDVKENDLVHGQWLKWLESIEIEARTAQRIISAFEQFGKTAASSHLPTGKIFEMLSLPASVDREEFIQEEHIVSLTWTRKTSYQQRNDLNSEPTYFFKGKDRSL